VGIRCADHVTPLYPQKLALISSTGGGRSVGIVRSRTKATEFSLVLGFVMSAIVLEAYSEWNSRLQKLHLFPSAFKSIRRHLLSWVLGKEAVYISAIGRWKIPMFLDF
jgi:hypothetical protein